MGCLRRLLWLAVLVLLCVVAWSYRARLVSYLPPEVRRHVEGWVGGAGTSSEPTATVAWELVTPEGTAAARDAMQKLAARSGPVYANFRPGDLVGYIIQELSHELPSSAEQVEAAAVGDELLVRMSVRLTDLGSVDLGPLKNMIGERETLELAGTIDIVKPGLGEYRVHSMRIRDLPLPGPVIPKLLHALDRSPRPEGVHDDALPLVFPSHIGDGRIRNGKITLYKVVS